MPHRKGERIRELTKRVGAPARVGTIIAVRDGALDVRWDDGHTTTLRGAQVVRVRKKANA